MESVLKINLNSFELSSKTESYMLGIWSIEDKIRIVILKNDEKYERLFSKEEMKLNQVLLFNAAELVNELKDIIQSHPQQVDISMIDNLTTVHVKKNESAYVSFENIPQHIDQPPIEQPIKSTNTKTKEEAELDPQTLSTLCEYLNKLNITISLMEKRLNNLSNHISLDTHIGHSPQPQQEPEQSGKKTINGILTDVSKITQKLEQVESKVTQLEDSS